MISTSFAYYAPTSLQVALDLLAELGEEARLLAGGHSLIPAMKLGLAAPSTLIDLGGLDELRGVQINGTVRIGSMATWHSLEQHRGLRVAAPLFHETVALIGDIQVRNRGTLGGSLAHADPAADIPAVVLALAADIHVVGKGGPRTISAVDFFVDLLTTALEPGEIMTAVSFKPLGAGEGAVYLKLAHPASRYAIVGLAAYLRLEGGRVRACRVALTGAGPKATRLTSVEQAMLGGKASAAQITAASAEAGAALEILGDMHAGEAYRRAIVGVYTRRALLAAAARAGVAGM